jgi:membrane-associated protease RseP (regulator of RpoE activity)
VKRKLDSPHLALAAAATLLLAAPIVAQDDETKKEERTFEKRIVIVGDHENDDGPFFERMIADKYNDVDCQEENGKKICIARVGRGLLPGFAGTFLGVELTETTPELREHLGGPRDAGVLVSRIQEESPAAEAGLQVGDIVTAVDGETVESARDLRHAIASREAGVSVKIDLYRDGRAEQVTATLAKREPRDFMKYFGPGMMLDPHELHQRIEEALEGIDLEQLDADVRKQLDAVDWDKIKETVREALDRAMEPRERNEEKR